MRIEWLHTGRVRFMELFVLHKIAKMRSRHFTKSFETNYGKLLGNRHNQYHNHSFAHHFWFGFLSVKERSLDGSFCDCGSADSMNSSAGRRERTCKCESPDSGTQRPTIVESWFVNLGSRSGDRDSRISNGLTSEIKYRRPIGVARVRGAVSRGHVSSM